MQRISNKEIITEIGNRQQLNSRALIRHTQGIVIRIAKRSLDRNLKRERSRKKNPLHKWRGPWINNTGKNKYMDHKGMDWFLREIVLQHLDFRLDTRQEGGGRVETGEEDTATFYPDLLPRMSVLGILWSTDTGIWFLLERSSLHSYTAHLRKGLVFYVKAELLLSARFKRNISRIYFCPTSA